MLLSRPFPPVLDRGAFCSGRGVRQHCSNQGVFYFFERNVPIPPNSGRSSAKLRRREQPRWVGFRTTTRGPSDCRYQGARSAHVRPGQRPRCCLPCKSGSPAHHAAQHKTRDPACRVAQPGGSLHGEMTTLLGRNWEPFAHQLYQKRVVGSRKWPGSCREGILHRLLGYA